MRENKALRWVKASERLPDRLVDKEYHARIKPFLSEEPREVIIKAMPDSVDFWIMNGYAFYCTAPAGRIIEWLDDLIANPADAPSNEGASQPGEAVGAKNAHIEVPEETKDWIRHWIIRHQHDFSLDGAEEIAIAMWNYCMESPFADIIMQRDKIRALQSQLSSIRSQNSLTIDAQSELLAAAYAKIKDLESRLSSITREADRWKKGCNELADIVSGKNLEIADYKQALEAVNRIYPSGVRTELLAKYQKPKP